MDWNLIRSFLAIARQGTLNGAARELSVNHSTMFRRLNQLEQSIGARLFDRLAEGYRLTQAGEALLSHAENIGDAFDGLERQLSGQDFRPRGNVRITAPDNIAYSYLPGYLHQIRTLYPEITFDLIVSNQDFNLSRREADIAVRATSQPPEYLIGKKVCSIGWSLYGQEDCQTTASDPISLLQKQRVIGADGSMAQLPAFRWLEKHLPDSICARSNDLVAMAAMAEKGIGIALLPDDQQRSGLKRLIPLPEGKQSDLWLLTHPDLRQVERIKIVLEHLTNSFRTDPALNDE